VWAYLLWVYEAVVVEVLVVHGKAAHPSHLGVAGLVHALAHHQHGVVHHAGGALRHGVDPHDVHNVDDTLWGGGVLLVIGSQLELSESLLPCFAV